VACADTPPHADERAPVVERAAVAVASADSTTAALFAEAMAFAEAQNLREEPLGVIMQRLGERFAGAPYVAGMLDAPEEETLITRLDAFDCVLFIETALALAQSVQAGDDSFEGYTRRLEALRYRGGAMDGYCSRLHYFSEWIRDNQRRGHVENLTEALGGVRLDKTLDFMSSNRGSYPRFAENDSLFQEVRAMEADLADVEVFHIPQGEIGAVYDRLRAGDIIATSTSLEGLDVTHTGLAYDHGDGTFGLLHASTTGGVTVSPDLQDYIQGNRVQIGIVVVRPLGAQLGASEVEG
jgi:hypothetical protein